VFIRAKRVGSHTYYQVVEGYREGGKVLHRTVVCLGRNATIRGAIAAAQARKTTLEQERAFIIYEKNNFNKWLENYMAGRSDADRLFYKNIYFHKLASYDTRIDSRTSRIDSLDDKIRLLRATAKGMAAARSAKEFKRRPRKP
jgi:hypothetical protein